MTTETLAKTVKPKLGVYIETLSWKEAEPILKETEVVLIPLGARTKEHGLHLPLNTDWLTAEYLARRVLDRVKTVALPTIEYGYFPAFTEYPGSVHIQRDTFRDYVVDICKSIAKFGPKKFYILNNGISTSWSLEPARQLLAKEKIWMEFTNLANEDIDKKMQTQEAGTHADEIETSVMLYIAPEVVNMKLALKDIHPDKGPGPLTRDEHYTTGVYSPTGAWGDPTLATKEKGRKLVEAYVDNIVAAIEKMQQKSFTPSPPQEKFLSSHY